MNLLYFVLYVVPAIELSLAFLLMEAAPPETILTVTAILLVLEYLYFSTVFIAFKRLQAEEEEKNKK